MWFLESDEEVANIVNRQISTDIVVFTGIYVSHRLFPQLSFSIVALELPKPQEEHDPIDHYQDTEHNYVSCYVSP